MKDIIQKLAQTDDEVYAKIGTVESVDLTNRTCDVIPLDGSAKLIDVYLQADSDNGGILQIPKVGSLICVVFINKETAILANTGAVDLLNIQIKKTVLEVLSDKMSLKHNQTIFEIDNDGFHLKKENETLKKLIVDLIGACKNMSFTLSTPDTINGSTTLLNNLVEFATVEERFNQFLK